MVNLHMLLVWLQGKHQIDLSHVTIEVNYYKHVEKHTTYLVKLMLVNKPKLAMFADLEILRAFTLLKLYTLHIFV